MILDEQKWPMTSQRGQMQNLQDRNQLAGRVAELRQELRLVDPAELAARTGAILRPGEGKELMFALPYWGQEVILTFPELVGYDACRQPLNNFDQAMLAYYFALSDGSPLAGSWISFFDLPNGNFYAQAFQGYSGDQMAKAFGNDSSAFENAARSLDGRPPWLSASLGDSAFVFQVFPHVSLLAVLWLGDEDFPPSYRVLFDAAISHHLSTDACAILGSMLTRRLLKAHDRQKDARPGA